MVAETGTLSGYNSPPSIITTDGQSEIQIENSYLLFNGDYSRSGSALVIEDELGNTLTISDYFSASIQPSLISPEGAKLSFDTVSSLAGPEFPGQFAQTSGQSGEVQAIGQIETLQVGATVQRADGTVEPLAVGTKVFQNDVVRTAAGGGLSITFVDGTIFTLSSNARMVLDELIYDPGSNENSAVFNLVEGSFVFIAGQVAKTGGMEVNTPAATMGIRGTTVKVDIETVNGVTTVDVKLTRDPDGSIGSIVLTDLDGNIIANINSVDSTWVVSPVEGETREIARTAEESANDQVVITEAVRAYQASQQRVSEGGEFVEQDSSGGDPTVDEDGEQPPEGGENPEGSEGENPPGEGPPEGAPEGGGEGEGEGEQPPAQGQPGSSGIGTDDGLPDDGPSEEDPLDGEQGNNEQSPPLNTGSSQANSGTGTPPPAGTPGSNQSNNQNTTPETATAPTITLPTNASPVVEDGQITVSGFSIGGNPQTIYTATLTAGSTISLSPGSGVTILNGQDGIDDTELVISGTPSQITAALNGLIYKPSPNDDDFGTLSIIITDGENTANDTLTIVITAEQDPPVAGDDALSRTEDAALFVGSLLTNDFDPDTTPVADTLSIASARHFGGGETSSPFDVNVPLGTAFTTDGGGSLVIFANGGYSFDPGTAYNGMSEGSTVVETFSYELSDGNGNFDTGFLSITIQGQNDAAVVTIDSAPPLGVEGNAGTSADQIITLFDHISASDADDFETPTIDQSSVTISPVTSSSSAAHSAVASSSGPFTVSGTGNATQVIVDTTQFDGLNQNEYATFEIDFDVISGAETIPVKLFYSVSGLNDQPTISSGSNLSVDEGGLVQLTTSHILGLDVDIDDQLTYFSDLVESTGQLELSTNPGVEIISFTHDDLLSGRVFYRHDGSDLTFETIPVTVKDGEENGATGVSATITVNINPINDDPTATGIPTSLNVMEDTSNVLSMPSLVIDDSDIDLISTSANNMQVIFTATNGTLSAAASTQLTISGNGTSSVTLVGTLANINSYLDPGTAISYLGVTDVTGTGVDTVTVSANDLGNTGTGGGTTVTLGTIDINVDATNDAPMVFVPATAKSIVANGGFETGPSTGTIQFTTVGNGSTAIDQWTVVNSLNYFELSSASEGTNNILLSSAAFPNQGHIETTLSTVAGQKYILTFDAGGYFHTPPTKTFDVLIDGSATPFTSDGVSQSNPDWEPNSLTFTATGSTTTLGFQSTTVGQNGPTIDNVKVQAIAAETAEDQSVQLTGISVADVDAGNADVTLTLSANNGDISINDSVTGGVTSSDITGNMSGSVQLVGTLAEINATLGASNGVVYLPDLEFAGVDVLTATINDGGASGAGTALTDVETFLVNVTPVNDAPIVTMPDIGIAGANFGGTVADYVVSNPVSGFPTGDFAVSFWVKDPSYTPTGPSGFETYFSYYHVGSGGALGEGLAIGQTNGEIGIALNTEFKFIGITAPLDGTWHHYVVNHDSTSGTFEVFIDGASAGPPVGGFPTGGTFAGGSLTLGVEQDTAGGGFDPDQTFTGAQADVAVWGSQLTQAEINNLVTDNVTPTNANIYMQWNPTTGAFDDISGSGNTFTTFGNVTSTNEAIVPELEDTVHPIREIVISDIDAGTGDVTVTISVSGNGVLDVRDDISGGLIAGQISGDLSSTLTLTGPVAAINATISGSLDFIPNTNANGFVQLTVTVNDNGNTGSGGPLNNSGSVIVYTVPVNDPAVVSGVTNPPPLNEGDQGTLSLSVIDLNGVVSFTDVDDTPFIDPDSIVISDNPGSSAPGSNVLVYSQGTDLIVDRGLFDFLDTGESAIFDVAFNIISGPETIARTATVTINGVTDNAINIVQGTPNADNLLAGTAGNDLILGSGNADQGNERLEGNDGADILVGSPEQSSLFGGDGDDTIVSTSTLKDRGDFVDGSSGNDRINYAHASPMSYQGMSYGLITSSIIFSLDAAANTATVDKGVNGTDTIIDIVNPLNVDNTNGGGGFGIAGSQFGDTFNLDAAHPNFDTWMQVVGGRGVDTYNLISGTIRLDFMRAENFDLPISGININLDTKTVNNDGFGNTETITGPQSAREVRGTDFNDTMVGSAADESFITRLGDDYVDGGLGFDRIRYERNGVDSVHVDLQAQSAWGNWDGQLFSDTLISIEHVRGSNQGVDFLFGAAADETFEGRGGLDVINGRGGNDTLTGGNHTDIFVFDPNNGLDTITDFSFGEDRISLVNFPTINATGDFHSFSFIGNATVIEFDALGNGVRVEGVDLTTLNPAEIFTFNDVVGTANDDTIQGTGANDLIITNEGNDRVFAGAGNDIISSGPTDPGFYNGSLIFGEAGDDLLISEQDGFTAMVGGAGNDKFYVANVTNNSDADKWWEGHVVSYFDSPSGITANLTSGTVASLNSREVADGYGDTDTLFGVMNISDSEFNDTFYIDGSLQNRHNQNRVSVRLSDGDDHADFTGASGARVEWRNANDGVNASLNTQSAVDNNLANGDQIGNDTFVNAQRLTGSRFDDLLEGNSSSNTFQGRGGNDYIDGMGLGDDDQVGHWGARSRVVIDFNLTSGQVVKDGFGGTDTLVSIENATGGLFSDLIQGDGNDNDLHGYAGNDILMGFGGSDYLSGDYGSSAAGLPGGGDFLAGEGGNDTLFGGNGADVFAFGSDDDFDFIQDFNFTAGDKIDVSEFGFTNTGQFSSFQFDPVNNWTNINFGPGGGTLDVGVTVAGVDLTTLSNPNDAFIFDFIGNTGSSLIGTGGNDRIRPFESVGENFVTGTAGSDVIDYTFAQDSFQTLSYSGIGAVSISVLIDGASNVGWVGKGALGVDTLFNINNPLQSGYLPDANGGFNLFGTTGNDVFTLDNGKASWMSVSGLDGNDTFTINSGLVRLDYSSGIGPIFADLNTGMISDGLGGTDTVLGSKGAWEIRGTDFNDTYIGSANDESFRVRGGNDNVNGGGGNDRVRYDDSQIGATGVTVDLSSGSATGFWNGTAFTDVLTSIENVRGSNGADIISGTAVANKLQGKGGSDTLIGGGGFDILEGQDGDDTLFVPDINFEKVDGGAGQDTLVISGGGQLIDFTDLLETEISEIENFDLGISDGVTEVTFDEFNVIRVSEEANTTIGTALSISGHDSILVDGDASDIVNLAQSGDITGASWQLNGAETTTFDLTQPGYSVYVYSDGMSTFARAVIDDDVTVNVI